jgi:hypothetical protein
MTSSTCGDVETHEQTALTISLMVTKESHFKLILVTLTFLEDNMQKRHCQYENMGQIFF